MLRSSKRLKRNSTLFELEDKSSSSEEEEEQKENNKQKKKCPSCHRYFTSLQGHLARSASCSIDITSPDSSIVTKIIPENKYNHVFSNKNNIAINHHNFNIIRTFDADSNLFEIIDHDHDNNEEQTMLEGNQNKCNENNHSLLNQDNRSNEAVSNNGSNQSNNALSNLSNRKSDLFNKKVICRIKKSLQNDIFCDKKGNGDCLSFSKTNTEENCDNNQSTYKSNNDSLLIDEDDIYYPNDKELDDSSDIEEVDFDENYVSNLEGKNPEVNDQLLPSDNEPEIVTFQDSHINDINHYSSNTTNNHPNSQYHVTNSQGNDNVSSPLNSNTITSLATNHEHLPYVPFSNLSYHHDLRHVFADILDYTIKFPIDGSQILCVDLLKMLIDGKVAASYYRKILDWHEKFIMLYDIDLHSIPKSIKCKNKLIDNLAGILYSRIDDYHLKPKHKLLQLPSGRFTKISTFDWKSNIISLLTDPDVLNLENTYFHDEEYRNPNLFHNRDDPDKTYDDVHHGSAFLKMRNKHCETVHDIFIGIIGFCDGTPIDLFSKMSLEVFMFTLTIFNQELRNKSNFWRIAGYVPDPCNEDNGQESYKGDMSGGKNSIKEQIEKRIDYHYMMRFILTGLLELEKSDGILWTIPNKERNGILNVRLRFAFIYMIGDALGYDKFCDRFLTYRATSNRLSRDCDCPTDKYNDVNHKCTMTDRTKLKQMTQSELTKICYYKIPNNAFDLHSFGDDPSGINGSTPWENLHQFNQGIVSKMIQFFEACITSKGAELIDRVVKYISCSWHRQSSREFPCIQKFKDGYSKKLLTGSEIMYKVFVLYLALIQSYTLNNLPKVESGCAQRYKTKKIHEDGEVTITSAEETELDRSSPSTDDNLQSNNQSENNNGTSKNKKKKTKSKIIKEEKVFYPKIGNNLESIRKWICLFEFTLCYDSWITQSSIKEKDIKISSSQACCPLDISIRKYRKLYHELVNDPFGNKGLNCKEHSQAKMSHQNRKFGPCSVFTGQVPEHNLSDMVKNCARKTQRRPGILIEQSTQRYYENLVINRVHRILELNGSLIDPPKRRVLKGNDDKVYVSKKHGHRYSKTGCFRILLNDDYSFKRFKWLSYEKQKGQVASLSKEFVQNVIAYLRKFGLESNYIDCFTSLKIDNDNGSNLYRADPCYHSKQWLDWCSTNWTITQDGENEDTEKLFVDPDDVYPTRLFLFIDVRKMEFSNLDISKEGSMWAMVRCTEKDNRLNNGRSRRSHDQVKKHWKCKLIHKSFYLDNVVRKIDVETILKPTYVICDLDNIVDEGGNKRKYLNRHIIELKDKTLWSELFIEENWER